LAKTTMTRRRLVLGVFALAGLLAVARVAYGLSVLGGLWWTVLSWDSPATHQFETLASVICPPGDPTRAARAQALASHEARGCPLLPDGPAGPKLVALAGPIPRSPPSPFAT
jgi:hypothetical protein